MSDKKKKKRVAYVAVGRSLTLRMGLAQAGSKVTPADLDCRNREGEISEPNQIAEYLRLVKKGFIVEKGQTKIPTPENSQLTIDDVEDLEEEPDVNTLKINLSDDAIEKIDKLQTDLEEFLAFKEEFDKLKTEVRKIYDKVFPPGDVLLESKKKPELPPAGDTLSEEEKKLGIIPSGDALSESEKSVKDKKKPEIGRVASKKK